MTKQVSNLVKEAQAELFAQALVSIALSTSADAHELRMMAWKALNWTVVDHRSDGEASAAVSDSGLSHD